MLKLASNFNMLVYFFVFGWIEKKDELLFKFYNEITQYFLALEGAFHNNIKKHNNKNKLIFNTNFNIPQPLQMTWFTHQSQNNVQNNCPLIIYSTYITIEVAKSYVISTNDRIISDTGTSRLQWVKN